jgi:DNA-binding XRE family transcriptional regulator
MMIPGQMLQEGGLFHAHLSALEAYGQGKTRRAACDALALHVLDVAASYRPLGGFKVSVADDGDATIYLTSNDHVRLVSTLLRFQREEHEMSLADVAVRLGGVSRAAYAQYEAGKREPSIGKLQELLGAVAPELVLSIVPRDATVTPKPDALDAPTTVDVVPMVNGKPKRTRKRAA